MEGDRPVNRRKVDAGPFQQSRPERAGTRKHLLTGVA